MPKIHRPIMEPTAEEQKAAPRRCVGCSRARIGASMRTLPTLSTTRTLLFAGLAAGLAALLGCGARAPVARAPTVDDDRPWPDPAVASLQVYLVMTDDLAAMQSKEDFEAVDAAVNGESQRFSEVRKAVLFVPNGYRVSFSADFAEPPTRAIPADQLKAILAELPVEARPAAEQSRLGVIIRTDAALLPDAGQVRLGGLVALVAAQRCRGFIVDMLTRRAYTPEAFAEELSGPVIGKRQVRLVTQKSGSGFRLFTRGLPKFGLPDLYWPDLTAAQLAAAQATFAERVERLRNEGPSAMSMTPCRAPTGFFDGACAEVD